MTIAKNARAVLRIGYTDFIMDAKAATEVFHMMIVGGVEIYEEKWVSATSTSEPRVTLPGSKLVTLRMLPNEKYVMGKVLQAADDKAKAQGETK